VVVTGYFQRTADFDPSAGTANLTSAGGSDIFIAKYNSSGDYLWANGIGGTGGDQGTSLTFDGSGNVVITGYFNGTVDFDPSAITDNLASAGGNDIFIAKYNNSGDYVWAKGIGGTGFDNSYSLTLDGSGNVVITGYFNGTADFDPSASTANITSAGGNEIFIARYNSSGDYLWAKGIGGTGGNQGNSLTLDGSGNVFVTGYFTGTADFDPSASTANLTSAGGTDIFIAKYNSLGDYVWAKGIGGTTNDSGNSLTLDGSGNLNVTGYFNGTADFDPSVNTYNLTSMSGGQYGFIASYATCTNPTAGGTIAAAQSGTSPFNPAAFTSSAAASGETGTLEYKWQSSTTNSTSGFSDIASSNATTYTAGALSVTTWFKRLARVACKSNWTGAAESNVIEVTVVSLLPVTGIELGGTATDKQVKLSFKALNEREMSNYAIERSKDGASFTNIGSLQASNANQASASYSFVDNQPIVGNNYYRIKGSSINGQIQYSNVAVVKYGVNMASVTVVPNPIQGKTVNLKLSQLAKGNYHISVTDAIGRSILKKEMLLDGSSSVQLNLPTSVKAGNYFVKVDGQGDVFVQSFIIQ
jgi:hypothetical protein